MGFKTQTGETISKQCSSLIPAEGQEMEIPPEYLLLGCVRLHFDVLWHTCTHTFQLSATY